MELESRIGSMFSGVGFVRPWALQLQQALVV